MREEERSLSKLPPYKMKKNEHNDPSFSRKQAWPITTGAQPFVKEHLLTRITKENCQIIWVYENVQTTKLNTRGPGSETLWIYSQYCIYIL